MKQRVLILCTANSSRSQMAEGWLRQLAGERIEVASAGTHPSTVNLLAIAAMRERGIDISHHTSKHLREFFDDPWDVVITVCDQAAENCPIFPGKVERIHWSFPDPAAVEGTEEEKLLAFRNVRDLIEAQFRAWLCEVGNRRNVAIRHAPM